MKNIIKTLLYLAFLPLLLTACCDEEDTETVTFNYALTCSPDLLKFVIPIVTYLDENMTEQTLTLTDSDWRESTTTTEVNGKKVTSLVFSKTVKLSEFDVKGKMEVKYKPKENNEFENGVLYAFQHSLTCDIEVDSDKLHASYTDFSMSLGITGYTGEEAKTYIENLATTPDKVTASVDKNGNVESEKQQIL